MTKPSTNSAGTNSTNNGNFARKPRRSIKAEGNCLNGMLREGVAKVIDASKLGKRLSSEIWNSFGAIQVEDSFTYPSIDTKTVADGSSTMKICQFFVACSKCFSVFKYDGHAYGTTGLVKHVKICQGTNNQRNLSSGNFTSNITTTTVVEHGLDSTHTSSTSVPNNNNTSTNTNNSTTTSITLNGPVTTRRRKEPTPNNRTRNAQPSLRHLAKVVEELRNEQMELKQKIIEMLSMMGTGYVGQIQIISNEGEKVEDALQKND